MMQDTRNNLFDKKLELRYYAQFPLFNYGFIPQTWEQNIRKD
jgi:inorganic pyrophosphatase